MTDTKLEIPRYFSEFGDPYADLLYDKREVLIRDDEGNVVEKIEGAVFPSLW